MKITIRPVKKEDLKKILEWRNEPEVRKSMFNTGTITEEEHEKYWERFLNDEKKFAYIIEKEGRSVGVIKLEIRTEKAEVNILVAPEFQGKGIGKTALKLIEEKAKEFKVPVLMSRIKPENEASIKIFEKNNFKIKHHYLEKKL